MIPLKRDMQARVNVVIAARHEEKYISACLEALLRQSIALRPQDIIVVINGHGDETETIAQRYGVTVCVSEAASVGGVRNAGIRMGQSQYLAFLDGHCIPCEEWLAESLACFDQPDVGGCAGQLEYICEDPRTQQLVSHSIYATSDTIWSNSIFAQTSPFPWIPSGNAVFLRRAIEAAGLFDESLIACEDVDLSWKVFLQGYRLVPAPRARVVHYDQAQPFRFAAKFIRYGRGAAQLARRYGFHCRPRLTYHRRQAWQYKALLQIAHGLGVILEVATGRDLKGMSHHGGLPLNRAVDELRPSFRWDSRSLKISNQCFYWDAEDGRTILCKTGENFRIELETTGAYIFACLTGRKERSAVIEAYARRYDVSEDQAAEDIDEFVSTLAGEKVLEISHSAP